MGLEQHEEQAVIIGGGPAGSAAAIQLRRLGYDPLLLEGRGVGGALAEANLVANYGGFPEGITGPAFCRLWEDHLDRAGVRVAREEVLAADRLGGVFRITTAARAISATSLIVASGTLPKRLEGVDFYDGVEASLNYGVAPLRGAKGKRVAVIGGGDVAFDYALTLRQDNAVVILCRGEEPRALRVLQTQAQRRGIDVRTGYRVATVRRRGVNRIELAAGGAGEPEVCDAVVVAVGRRPADGFLGGGLLEEEGWLTASGALRFAGDVRNGGLRQAAIAAGDGVRAAFAVASYLAGAYKTIWKY